MLYKNSANMKFMKCPVFPVCVSLYLLYFTVMLLVQLPIALLCLGAKCKGMLQSSLVMQCA